MVQGSARKRFFSRVLLALAVRAGVLRRAAAGPSALGLWWKAQRSLEGGQ